MDQPGTTVHSGGGAVFTGDVTAGRDVVINNFTEIRQVSEQLYNHCSTLVVGSDDLLGRLDNLQWIAEIVEEDAKELQPDIPAGDAQLQRVFHECVSVLSELRSLSAQIHDSSFHREAEDENGTDEFSLGDELDKTRARLMALQMKLSRIRSKRIAQDTNAIKAAVIQLLDSPGDADDASSIRSFYTTSSVPYVERQMWREVERSLRSRFSPEFVRDHFALIVSTVEETIWDNAAFEPTNIRDPSVRLSEVTTSASPDCIPLLSSTGSTENIETSPELGHEARNSSQHMVDSVIGEHDHTARYDAAQQFSLRRQNSRSTSMMAIHPSRQDKTGRTWAESIDDDGTECLITFDGGGVKAYSSMLIVKKLMFEIEHFENIFESEFTHYRRQLKLRPCHYFDKMYGTSTGGLIAILLGRLRMTAAQSTDVLCHLLTEMYTHAHINPMPLSTKYYHQPFEAAMAKVVEEFDKEHFTGGQFPWPSLGNQEEQALCQAVCLTATHSGQFEEAFLLRTYNHVYDPDLKNPWITPYNEGAENFKTWQVARATTAAPFYFNMLIANARNGRAGYKDGGIRENNPSYCAYLETSSLHGGEKEPSLLLSIGAGHLETSGDAFGAVWPGPLGSVPAVRKWSEKFAVFKNVLIKASEGESRHQSMRTIARGEYTWYKRLNVVGGLEQIKVDQWESGLHFGPTGTATKRPGGKTMSRIELATQLYLDRDHQEWIDGAREYQPPKIVLKQIAEKLVRLRRARELEAMTAGGEKRARWEAYMGKHLPGEQEFFREYLAQWDFAMLGRKQAE